MTPLWTARELLEATGGSMDLPFDATGVSIDTRTLRPGDLFIALLGEGRDGHAFVADALAAGAAGAMVHRDVPGATRLLRVDDTLAALARLGGFSRERSEAQVIAVTGSVGKTTTKEMLRTALSPFGITHAAVASYNNHWGLPLTLARQPREAAFCIVEIGMNHAGEIAPLTRLARPHVAVITTVEKAHIGHLGSIEAIADEKAAIMHGLEPGGVAVLPADSPLFPRLREAAIATGAIAMAGTDLPPTNLPHAAPQGVDGGPAAAMSTGGASAGATGSASQPIHILTFGTTPSADAHLISIEQDADGSVLVVDIAGRDLRLRLNAPGRHMAMNAVATLAAVVAVGLDPAAAAVALEAFRPLGGRGARRALALPAGNALLLDESYNGNGASMRGALDVLRLQPARRRIAVLGDMLELGIEGPAEHRGLATEAAAAADLVFACGPLMRHLFDALPAAKRATHAADSRALASIVAAAIRPGDAVLIKGSLGSQMKRVVDALDALAQPRAGAA